MRIFDSIEQLRGGLDYHLARHNLLVANLGQADTPGFKPMDLERTSPASFEGVLHTAIQATQPGHISAPHTATTGETWRVVQDPGAAGNDGNSVSLDREAVKIASNQLRYDTLASLVQNQLSGLAWAANDGK
jgi:flagellar basal-body rod protein FlgB